MADPREQWAREVKVNRHRTLTAVVLACSVVVTLFFVGLRAFLIHHVAAEQALGGPRAAHPAVHGTVPAAAASREAASAVSETPSAASSSEPQAAPAAAAKRHRQALDPADPMVVDDDDSSPLAASSEQLQVVYIAIACSGFAMIAAVVAFARAWR